MTNIESILIFIVAVSILAFLHELGHFLTARMFNIEVEEFGLGFPPRAARLFRWRGTDFTLNWIPFGAFVRLKRLVVLLGGPVMNLITGMVLFTFIFLQTGVPDEKRVVVNGIVEGSAAEKAGLQAGDVIVSANGVNIDSTDKVRSIIQANPNKPITLELSRSGKTSTLQATPNANPPKGEGILGVMLTNPLVAASWPQTIPMAANISIEYAKQLFTAPVKLVLGQLSADQGRVTSIFGLGNLFVQARERDIQSSEQTSGSTPAVSALTLMAIISIALGITNLLPIPALDGGRILFLLPELLLRKRIPPKYENTVHLVGFMALLLLMVVVTIQDIINPVMLP
jgi:regulator of sigma E protease